MLEEKDVAVPMPSAMIMWRISTYAGVRRGHLAFLCDRVCICVTYLESRSSTLSSC